MIYLFTFLIFIFGLILGFYFNFPFGKFIKTLFSKANSTINANKYFNEIEISIFSKILTSPDKSISSHELTLIINQKNLSSVELNRLKRLILKDLNLKNKIVFGITNGIWQVDSFEEKKLKKFMLSKKFNVSQLKKIFLS